MPENVSIHTADPDEAMDVGGSVYYPHRYTRVSSSSGFGMALEATCLGPVTIGVVTYDTDLSLQTGDLGAYQVNVPLSGALVSRTRGVEVTTSSTLAAVYRPTGDAMLRCAGTRSSFAGIKIEVAPLEAHLATLVRCPTRSTLALPAELDLSSGMAAAWWSMVQPLLRGDVARRLVGNPLVVRPLVESLMSALLCAIPHQYQDQLNRPQRPATHSYVQRAVDLIHASPETPWTPATLADAVSVGLRTLQLGFRHELDMSIMHYVERVRLERVRHEFVTGVGQTSVSRTATRWGFTHLGRFAAKYRDTYGEHPSDTIVARRSM